MKIEKVFLDVENFDLVLKIKTPLREIVIWKTWYGKDKTIIDKLEQICQNDIHAIINFKNGNDIILKEFSEIRLLEFPNEKIEIINKNKYDSIFETTIHASQLL